MDNGCCDPVQDLDVCRLIDKENPVADSFPSADNSFSIY